MPGEFENVGAARAKRRAEVTDGLAGNLRQNVARTCEFVEHVGGSATGEIGVRPGMIADEVAGIRDAMRQLWFCSSEFSDHEEGGAHVVFGKDVEKTRRPCGVGAIVEGESELAGEAWGNEGAAEDLRGWPAGGVGKTADAEPGCAGDTDNSVNSRG